MWLYLIISNRSGDIEKNPGPKPNSCKSFSICHRNLNRISVHNFLKLSLLRACITVHKFDVIQSLILIHPFYMMTMIYKFQVMIFIGKDHPLNIKRGGVCIYYKISLPLKIKNIHYLQECINFEIKIKDKLCNFISLYRSPNQSQDDFESFINNLECNLDSVMVNNPFLIVSLGDFNAKSSLWHNNDVTTVHIKAPKLTL